MSRQDPSTPRPDESTTREDPTERADDPSDPVSGLIGTGEVDEEAAREAGEGGTATVRGNRTPGAPDDPGDDARDR